MTTKKLSLKKQPKEEYSDNRFDPYTGKVIVVNLKSPSVLFGELVYVGKQHLRLEKADEYVLIDGQYKTFASFTEIVVDKQSIGTVALWDRDDLPEIILKSND
jgi:hypothetical protein